MTVKNVLGSTLSIDKKLPVIFLINMTSTGNSFEPYWLQSYYLTVTFKCYGIKFDKDILLTTGACAFYNGMCYQEKLFYLIKNKLSGYLTEKELSKISNACMTEYLDKDIVQEATVLETFHKLVNYTRQEED